MPREFPSPVEVLRQLTEFPTDTVTERGRRGFLEMIKYIRDLVQDWGLGQITEQEFTPDDPYGNLEPRLKNLFIDVNVQQGREMGLWHGHGDTIWPDKEYQKSGRTPTHLMNAPEGEHVYMGCGVADMKLGLTAYLTGLRGLDEILRRVNRSIRLAIVSGEENESEGTYVAKPYLQGAQWGISMEIPVGGTLADPPTVYHGRPGRAVYDVKIQGLKSMHLGAVDPEDPGLLVPRWEKASETIRRLRLQSHPNHSEDFVPRSICYPNELATVEVRSMTTSSEAHMKVEVLYTNPDLELVGIEEEIRRALGRVLHTGFDVELARDRPTPWTRPWLEDHRHPFVQAAIHEASQVVGHSVEKRYARGVADENILAHWGIPMVLFPPQAEGEHTATERGDVSSVQTRMVPFLHRMAKTDRNLVDWQA